MVDFFKKLSVRQIITGSISVIALIVALSSMFVAYGTSVKEGTYGRIAIQFSIMESDLGFLFLILVLVVSSLPIIGLILSVKKDDNKSFKLFTISTVFIQLVLYLIMYLYAYDYSKGLTDSINFDAEIGLLLTGVVCILGFISAAVIAPVTVGSFVALGGFGFLLLYFIADVNDIVSYTYTGTFASTPDVRYVGIEALSSGFQIVIYVGVVFATIVATVMYEHNGKYARYLKINIVALVLFIIVGITLLISMFGIDEAYLLGQSWIGDDAKIYEITWNYGNLLKWLFIIVIPWGVAVGIISADHFIKERD